MKLTNLIIERFGSDKIIHFLGGALIVALFGYFGWYAILIGIILTLLISFIKEIWLDDNFDYGDIIATIIGSIISFVIYFISRWLC